MKIDSFERATSGTGARRTFYIYLRRYPSLRSFLWARTYTAYARWIPQRIPGWRRFMLFIEKHGAEWELNQRRRIRDRLYSWQPEQDMRAWKVHDVATPVGSFEVNEDDYHGAKF